ncbi:TIGR01621 family pseudouridine synthase [Paraphotobacterium marinum]|uniref:TIGR01621 family pseudouridine synthase n=1 Tax=Paraphotobacterium marinum TaxID=1755811 RepID=A0A220VDW8_9GAMM|nr:TIGR01621 family pseudouridine synthase [Paraphotobacterium marinum]
MNKSIPVFNLIFQNEDFIVVDKHPGVNVHYEGNEYSLLESIKRYLNFNDIYLLHRLDKDTSGLMVLGKSKKVAQDFYYLFKNEGIQKIYIALGKKKIKKKMGIIKGDMSKSRNKSWILKKTYQNPAITKFISAGASNNKYRHYFCYPLTGKTHQIRVALKSIGAEIIGDKIYGSGDEDRMYLHSLVLSFNYKGADFNFQCAPKIGLLWQKEIIMEQLLNTKEKLKLNKMK